MFSTSTLAILGLTLCSAPAILAVDHATDPALNAQLRMATMQLDRLNLLADDQLKYDFATCDHWQQYPGSVCNANQATFPASDGSGVTVAQLNIGPCAMLSPHIHRATNMVVAVAGTTHTYMKLENGARVVQQTLKPGQMTVFPASSLHAMINPTCESNMLYSFLNSDDPGTLNFAQGFWDMGEAIGLQVMPQINIGAQSWQQAGTGLLSVGTGVQGGPNYAACMQACGLTVSGQNTTSSRIKRW